MSNASLDEAQASRFFLESARTTEQSAIMKLMLSRSRRGPGENHEHRLFRRSDGPKIDVRIEGAGQSALMRDCALPSLCRRWPWSAQPRR
jgi:hypothetical protein